MFLVLIKIRSETPTRYSDWKLLTATTRRDEMVDAVNGIRVYVRKGCEKFEDLVPHGNYRCPLVVGRTADKSLIAIDLNFSYLVSMIETFAYVPDGEDGE